MGDEMCGNLERGRLMGACLIHCHMFHRKLIIMVCMYSWILCVCFLWTTVDIAYGESGFATPLMEKAFSPPIHDFFLHCLCKGIIKIEQALTKVDSVQILPMPLDWTCRAWLAMEYTEI